MRYKSIRLVNYIGIYNGLQLNEIFIDFSKCQHNTIVIKGDNGSGKSTIFNALNPLPDGSDNFIPGAAASKEIEMYDGGNLFFIRFIHGIKSNGDREVTKAYISRIGADGLAVDLNPNGNVSSFKDILYEEFKLDSNFVALSQLSWEDRGLVDRRPADRKKFVNSIIETLEVYNGIYKNLTKKSVTLKNLIGSITSKLDNIGNPELIAANLAGIDEKLKIYRQEKDITLEQKADARAIVTITDPNRDIQNKYTQLGIDLDTAVKESAKISATLESIGNVSIDDIDMELTKLNTALIEATTNIQIAKNQMSSLLADRESESKALQQKTQKLNALQNEDNITTINNGIKNSKSKIAQCEEFFNTIGVRDAIRISKEEYVLALNALKDIKDTIDYFKSNSSYTAVQSAIDCIESGIYPEVDSVKLRVTTLEKEIQELDIKITKINNRDNILKQLSAKPDDCKREDCGFINSVKTLISGMPEDLLRDVENERFSKNEELRLASLQVSENSIIQDHIGRIKAAIRVIDNNRALLQKFNLQMLHLDNLDIFRDFIKGESFRYIDELYAYIDYANLFEEYKMAKESLDKLEAQAEIYKSRNNIIDEIMSDIESISAKLDDITNHINEYNNTLITLERQQLETNVKINKLSSVKSMMDMDKKLTTRIDELTKERIRMADDMETISKALTIIADCTSKENDLSIQIQTMSDDRDKLTHALRLIDEYNRELEEYNKKYSTVEKVKYYSSPTSGIQLVFMELYMSKILSLSNELLANLFGGAFIIQPFVITDTEFRIPVLGKGLMNDDITSMSGGEKAMISMIISLALLRQSSSKYNVVKLDEIDGPLDATNRTQFLLVLDMLMQILQSEQCIMISHNAEINTDNVDLIVLKNSSGDTYSGNIIYKY